MKVKYLAAYCFSGTYIITLLTEGYNFSSESYSSIQFIKKVGRWPSSPVSHKLTQTCTALAHVFNVINNDGAAPLKGIK